jgi:5-formyltetrahydrofolate cyclo-ligase
MIDAAQIRKTTLAARNRLTPAEIADKSAAITRTLLSLEPIRNRQTIFVYVSFRSEVATFELIDALLAMGKTVTVPITRVAEKRLDAIRIENPATELEPGYCAIPEPKKEICLAGTIAPTGIETILLPGSVFDLRGGRFGYGGGYYDRFLEQVPAATRIGLAFDLQIIDKAPLREHDEILDLVITESRVIRGER